MAFTGGYILVELSYELAVGLNPFVNEMRKQWQYKNQFFFIKKKELYELELISRTYINITKKI